MVACRPVESGWIALEGYVPECNSVPENQWFCPHALVRYLKLPQKHPPPIRKRFPKHKVLVKSTGLVSSSGPCGWDRQVKMMKLDVYTPQKWAVTRKHLQKYSLCIEDEILYWIYRDYFISCEIRILELDQSVYLWNVTYGVWALLTWQWSFMLLVTSWCRFHCVFRS